MPLSAPPFQSLSISSLSLTPLLPTFPPLLPPITPSALPERNLQAVHREVPRVFPCCCHFHYLHLVLLFCWRLAFTGSVQAPQELSPLIGFHVARRRPAVCISASYMLPSPKSIVNPLPPQHISYLLSTRCLKIQTPLNFCQCLHVLSAGRGVKCLQAVRLRSFHCSALSSFLRVASDLIISFFFLHIFFIEMKIFTPYTRLSR